MILIRRLSQNVYKLSEAEEEFENRQNESKEEKLKKESLNKMITVYLRSQRRRGSIPTYSEKMKLNNFLLDFVEFIDNKDLRKLNSTAKKRNKTQKKPKKENKIVLELNDWTQEKKKDLSQKQIKYILNPKNTKFSSIMSNPSNYSQGGDLRISFNCMTKTKFIVGIDNRGCMFMYQSYFKNEISRLISIPNLKEDNSLKAYYKLNRLEKANSLDISNLPLKESNDENDNFNYNNNDIRLRKNKTLEDGKQVPNRIVPLLNMGFDDYKIDRRGSMQIIDSCLKKILYLCRQA